MIRWSLERKGFLVYIRRILNDYFSDRYVEFPAYDDRIYKREMLAGVSQGSILGLLLWYIAYDHMDRLTPKSGSVIIVYANNTIVLSRGRSM